MRTIALKYGDTDSSHYLQHNVNEDGSSPLGKHMGVYEFVETELSDEQLLRILSEIEYLEEYQIISED